MQVKRVFQSGDTRYSYRLSIGTFTPRYIVMFCGDIIGQCRNLRRTPDIAFEHALGMRPIK